MRCETPSRPWSVLVQKIVMDEELVQKMGRSHFGTRAISVQVNIATDSDHVFHRFPFDLPNQVSPPVFHVSVSLPCS